ncbi:MAG TPA: hypothetical protein VNT75_27165 [Symbiobacteriaceae bacterium]|nr:hypothetical protein [Symbiobacteriaceae bacterium]
MSYMGAIRSFLQGAEAFRRRAAERLNGSPYVLKLTYLGGHPGIWDPAEFYIGRVEGCLRLVDQRGERCYDLPIDRINGMGCDEEGHVELQFEPTAGLVTTVAFQSGQGGTEGYRKLVRLIV